MIYFFYVCTFIHPVIILHELNIIKTIVDCFPKYMFFQIFEIKFLFLWFSAENKNYIYNANQEFLFKNTSV